MHEERKTVSFEDIERRFISSHQKPYYDWLRNVVTLALAALTSLVALQGHYVPQKPSWVLLLALGWVSLALTILFGLFALKAEYRTPLDAVLRLRRMRASYGDDVTATKLNRNLTYKSNFSHKWSVVAMVICFSTALISICLFAIVNLPWGY
ncbi:hypothetical protein [Rheinheimera gaetbuli]